MHAYYQARSQGAWGNEYFANMRYHVHIRNTFFNDNIDMNTENFVALFIHKTTKSKWLLQTTREDRHIYFSSKSDGTLQNKRERITLFDPSSLITTINIYIARLDHNNIYPQQNNVINQLTDQILSPTINAKYMINTLEQPNTNKSQRNQSQRNHGPPQCMVCSQRYFFTECSTLLQSHPMSYMSGCKNDKTTR